ncbi:Hsp30 protein [Saccharomycopsis crataegensis]|uniref:Hsp30 protein n=1 Tax=Saccharomycopsis crataegensis TaxID=43959 RepID=A0AAV5QIV2_9ASCO|nr:Hsp30 protein [Saccharomycopsis crataegensis]
MPALFERSNEAVSLNPPTGADLHLTSHGSDWLWAAFSLFGVFAVAHAGLFLFKGKKSVGHIAALSVNAILAFTYFTLASDLGWAAVETEFKHVTVSDPLFEDLYYRQVFYARYIGWFLGWPVLLFLVEFVGNGSTFSSFTPRLFATYALEVGGSEVFVLGLLIGSLISSTYKWGYFTFSTVSLLFIMSILNYNIFKHYTYSTIAKLSLLLLDLVWILYPVAWGLADGGNVIQSDSENVFYGVLDLILFAFIPTILVFQSNNEVEEPVVVGNHADSKELEPEVPRASGETAV